MDRAAIREYCMGEQYSKMQTFVGDKTENQTLDMFLSHKFTQPNTVIAVAHPKRAGKRKAYEKVDKDTRQRVSESSSSSDSDTDASE